MKRFPETLAVEFDPRRYAPGRRRRAWRGWTLFLVFLLAAGGGLYAHARTSSRPFWTVGAVWVEGNRSISTAELMDRLRLHPGMPWWRVSLLPARELAHRKPRLASIDVSWKWPRDLIVRVQERESVLRVLAETPLELSQDGILLEPEERIDPADLPILTGDLPAGLVPGRRLDLAEAGPGWRELLDSGREMPSLWKKVSQIHYVGGRIFQVFLREGHRVIVWDCGINDEAKRQIPAVLADLGRQGIEDAVLDLRFRDQIVVRREAPEPDSGPEG